MSAPTIHAPALRPARPDDLGAVLRLIHACDTADIGEPDYTEADVRTDWSAPGFDLERDARVVELADGAVVAYVRTHLDDDRLRVAMETYVHPDRRGGDLETLLTAWAVDHARGLVEGGAPGSIRTWVAEDGDDAARLEAAGFTPVRRFYRMVLEFGAPLDPPSAPEGIEIRTFDTSQALGVHAAVQEAFADHWDHHEEPFEEWRARKLDSDDFDPRFWWVAWDGPEIAGAVLATVADELPNAWIGSVSVRRPWRGRGLALALLRHAFAEIQTAGKRGVALGVDAENQTGATQVYERAGMHVAISWVLFEREI